ncbi:MAG: hypothetical protein LKM44_02225 [Wolbachia endosymbiont of Meromenopon meropis]|nr:hypothetical protein [Wolbachia endosymbiont of Meromenopon meropis]
MANVWNRVVTAINENVTKIMKNLLFLVPGALSYIIKKPFASWRDMKRDAFLSLRRAFGVGVKESRYELYVQTTEASKNLGLEVVGCKDHKIKFLASKTLIGDIPCLTSDQLVMIENLKSERSSCSRIFAFKEKNKIVIEINVEKIVKKVFESVSEDKRSNSEEVRKLVLQKVHDEVDRVLKELGKITGGEFKHHADQKLLYCLTEKLYRNFHNQNELQNLEGLSEDRSSEIAIHDGESSDVLRSLETIEVIAQNNMTNPCEMYHIRANKKASFKVMKAPRNTENQVREVVCDEPGNFLLFEKDIFDSGIKSSSSTPFVRKQEKRGK